MQLRNARLCLDCEEVHDAAHCPLCASESFAFITRWVPSPSADATGGAPDGPPERRVLASTTRVPMRDRSHGPAAQDPVSRETLDTYRQLLSDQTQAPSHWRFVKRGALGLAIFGLAGWAWKQQTQRAGTPRDDQGLDGN
jgi:hypothetical protein